MPNVIGKMPEFTTDDTVGVNQKVITEVKETPEPLTETGEEKGTPTELPTEIKLAEPSIVSEEGKGDDTEEKKIQGILNEREKLLKEIQELRGQRRELRKEKTEEIITEVADNLEDLNPDDIKNIERVMKARGYITKTESQKIYYESAKNQALNEFLERYPEYKPENDRDDINWNALQRELSFYKMPSTPTLIKQVLEKAHRAIAPSVDQVSNTTQKRIATAQKGGGGTQRSSSGKRLPSHMRRAYEDGGWSEEEIQEIENKL